METVAIRTLDKNYFVKVGNGAMDGLAPFLKENFPALTSLLVITDETVGRLYLQELENRLEGQQLHVKVVPSGEEAKTFDVYYGCLSFALEKKLDRKSLILAFGGGAVGDLAGFVAATFMRGIPFIQIPTTILAHDSAVGGKVAINHPLGKNMIGAFHQPEAVFYDLRYLETLPQSERRSGFAEAIKHALIKDAEFYEWLLDNVTRLDAIQDSILEGLLVKGIRIKGDIVEKDEKELGVRAFLNFGHTLGHAIEGECGYGRITHGEAVLIGMLFALKLSKEILGLSFDSSGFRDWIEKLGYKSAIPEGVSADNLLQRMKQDKKSTGGKVMFVLLKETGSPVKMEISDELLLSRLNEFQRRGSVSDQRD
ncbi:3-dehydroquinate synthase [Mesobacillus zeae]|uniref:3-dehydroquinate synthase n=1 Tax=Mesobacillus zeae TaxID=1917180 RepID=A0A398AY78_9BACI|nr:3-dehydroquinate synthase [Mesobacillus zeae]RID82577.1 3-dehydroquinate synthase [Mesobacillus zeae]